MLRVYFLNYFKTHVDKIQDGFIRIVACYILSCSQPSLVELLRAAQGTSLPESPVSPAPLYSLRRQDPSYDTLNDDL